MKKYIIGLTLLFVMYNTHAMELSLLSSEDDAKAKRFAKLIYKYPNGFDGKKEKKDVTKSKMDLLLKQDTIFSKWVVRYHNLLNNRDAEEILDGMYNNKLLSISKDSQPGFKVDLKNKIFSTIVFDFLYEDAKQYYATSNALEFIKIKEEKCRGNFFDMNLYKRCFLSEVNQDAKFTLSIKCYDVMQDGKVSPQCDIYENEKFNRGLRNYSQDIIKNLVNFLNENTKTLRINNFKILLEDYINDLSKASASDIARNKFIKLLELKNHNNEQYLLGFKGPDKEYLILPLKELLAIENIDYDIEFYTKLAESNGKGASMINIDEKYSEKWKQFTPSRQKSLENICIKLKKTPRTFIEHAIILGAFGINAIMPDMITHGINIIIPTSGWKNTTITTLSLFTSLVFNIALGNGFFPQLYAKFNSHTPLVEACIKKEQIREHTYEDLFSWLNLFHILSSLIGNKCLSFIDLPAQIIGITIHGLRAVVYYLTIKNFTDSRDDIYRAKHLKTNINN